MAEHNDAQTPEPRGTIDHHLASLKLGFIAEQYAALATQAAPKAWSPIDYLATLLEGEANVRHDRVTKSRMRLARFPVIKTLEQFRWDWPPRINRLQVQNHCRLECIKDKVQWDLTRWCRPGEHAPGDRVGLCRLPPGLRGALCQCY
jgi:hypothetical protein